MIGYSNIEVQSSTLGKLYIVQLTSNNRVTSSNEFRRGKKAEIGNTKPISIDNIILIVTWVIRLLLIIVINIAEIGSLCTRILEDTFLWGEVSKKVTHWHKANHTVSNTFLGKFKWRARPSITNNKTYYQWHVSMFQIIDVSNCVRINLKCLELP